jgi:2-polyprenyl-3-methyl-5-hydroxy-6-metoxy-1,4-benzoquinol methylase
MRTSENMVANDATCPACYSTTLTSRHCVASDLEDEVRISIHECAVCGIAWQYPVLRTAEESAVYFSRKYEAAQDHTYFDKESKRKIAELELEFVRRIAPSPGRLLDIGAGDGTFISAAADAGWQCTGIDPAPNENFSYKRVGVGTAGLLQTYDALAETDHFDVITMWDVIEHVERPADILSSAAKLLSDEGAIVIETGNYQSVDRIDGGKNWWCYQADHRWYFSPATLVPLLNATGLSHVVIAGRVLRPWWKGTAAYSGPSVWKTTKQLCKSPFIPFKPIRHYLDLRRASDRWRKTAGLGIFTIAASRNPISAMPGDDYFVLT